MAAPSNVCLTDGYLCTHRMRSGASGAAATRAAQRWCLAEQWCEPSCINVNASKRLLPTHQQSEDKAGGRSGQRQGLTGEKSPTWRPQDGFLCYCPLSWVMAVIKSYLSDLSQRPYQLPHLRTTCIYTSYRADDRRSHANKLSGNLMLSAPTKTPASYLHLVL